MPRDRFSAVFIFIPWQAILNILNKSTATENLNAFKLTSSCFGLLNLSAIWPVIYGYWYSGLALSSFLYFLQNLLDCLWAYFCLLVEGAKSTSPKLVRTCNISWINCSVVKNPLNMELLIRFFIMDKIQDKKVNLATYNTYFQWSGYGWRKWGGFGMGCLDKIMVSCYNMLKKKKWI